MRSRRGLNFAQLIICIDYTLGCMHQQREQGVPGRRLYAWAFNFLQN
ncbi:MAG: hypothetical protein FJZ80_02285 [Bacteroidetes bacterium]|nr:hypothetical protein [Bacteroidota bacterium]